MCEYSRSRSFHDDLILQDQASGERSQDLWSSGFSCFMTCLSGEIIVEVYEDGLEVEYQPFSERFWV